MSEPECIILTRLLDSSLQCMEICEEIRPASYRDEKHALRGCLIAHSLLSLMEAQRLQSIFKKPLYKVFRENAIGSLEGTHDRLWQSILSAVLIHDFGKLTESYQEARPQSIRHHVISAIIARRALESIFGGELSLKLAYAVLFHHEAIDWKSLEESLLGISYLSEVLESKPIAYTPSRIPRRKLQEAFANGLKLLEHAGIITMSERKTLEIVLDKALEEVYQESGRRILPGYELEKGMLRDVKYQVPAIAVYRLIYLADNRAASARTRHWMEALERIDWDKLEEIGRRIHERLLETGYYIGLSSIPSRN